MMTDGKYLVTTSFKYAMKYSPERFRDEEITKQRIKKKKEKKKKGTEWQKKMKYVTLNELIKSFIGTIIIIIIGKESRHSCRDNKSSVTCS